MYRRIALALLVAAAAAGCGMFSRSRATMGDVPADSGWLELTVNVKNAKVMIDGALRGMIKKADSPQLFVIPAGTHDLQLEKFGYETYAAKIAVEPGAVNTLVIDMSRLPTEVVELPEEKAE
jgi:hypothetical protein